MKLRKFARGKPCQIRLIGVCNNDPGTTVLAHYRRGHLGIGCKPHDLIAAHACSACHDEVDGRTQKLKNRAQVDADFMAGVIRTQRLVVDAELI